MKNLLSGIFYVGLGVVALSTFLMAKKQQSVEQKQPSAGTCVYTPTKEGANLPSGERPSGQFRAVIATELGEITARLDADRAPCAVQSFGFLAENGFYAGLGFHRVVPGFVIQGGDPTGTGGGNAGYRYDDELKGDEVYGRGVLALANAGPDTNGSQFFIVLKDTPSLPKNYTIFGAVRDGMDVVDAIAAGKTEGEKPVVPVKMRSVTVTPE